MPVSMLSTSLVTEPKRYGRFNALDTENPFALKPGMVLIKPTSIANSGGSATIGPNGQVTFSAINSVSLDGVFTADFDNYVLVMQYISSANSAISARYRAAGIDASGTNYAYQRLEADNTTVAAARASSQTSGVIATGSTTARNGQYVYIYGPYLAQPTTWRNVSVRGVSNAYLDEFAGNHSLFTSYGGITIISGGTETGKLAFYGVRS